MRLFKFGLVCLFLAAPAGADEFKLPFDFNQQVLAGMEKWHAPGLGLTIVKDGETVLAKGYGVRSLKTNIAVDKNTVFQAGSTTKAFAAMSLAMLADEGKLNWNDPVKKHLPELRIKDKYVEENLTIADALSHRSGISPVSNLNIFMNQSMKQSVELLAVNGQVNAFRDVWDYNNTTFGLSGLIVERLSGMPFHEFVTKRILQPLGMDDTLLLDAEVKARENRAEAHQYYKGEQHEIGYPYIEYTKSAGMMNSTPEDMDKWLKFLLAGGKWQGEQLVSEANFAAMFDARIFIPAAQQYPALGAFTHNYSGYGLAWFLNAYRGYNVVMHTGSINGMSAIIGMIPSENIGVYVLINSDHIEYRHALMYTVFDMLLGLPSEDVADKIYAIYNPEHAEADAPNKDAAESMDTTAAMLGDSVVGHYAVEGGVPLVITAQSGGWLLTLGQREFPLNYAETSGYTLLDPDQPFVTEGNPVTFTVEEGQITGLMIFGMEFSKK